MAIVKEITLTTSPTVVIGNDYIKAGASITFTIEEDDAYDEEIDQAIELLKDAYRHALLAELQAITQIQKKESRIRIVKWLKRIIHGKTASSSEE